MPGTQSCWDWVRSAESPGGGAGYRVGRIWPQMREEKAASEHWWQKWRFCQGQGRRVTAGGGRGQRRLSHRAGEREMGPERGQGSWVSWFLLWIGKLIVEINVYMI